MEVEAVEVAVAPEAAECLHFDVPGSSNEPYVLYEVSERQLTQQLLPSPPSSPPSSTGRPSREPASLSPSDLSYAQRIIDSAADLHLTHSLPSGYVAQVFSGHLVTSRNLAQPVVFKVYAEDNLEDLLREMSAYARLSHLSVTPALLGAFSALQEIGWSGTGLLLENDGVQVGSGDSWVNSQLGTSDKLRLYDALTELHRAGVQHSDFVPRNVLRRHDGSFSVIDFGNATVDHLCSGTECEELKELRDALKI
ncbi:hypothetical protein B0H12DRAFT_834193 [Mycena haematopus]|nr:hypothetical protein B0H12DRAFT_834193 [Mycena haematopus]